jgi:group I intron endonuclease
MDNTGKTGIYILISKSTNRVYIGSAVNLSNRLNDYFQESYLKNRKNTFIVRELNKYGMENFSIGILEYTSSIKKEILLREQY